MPRDVPGAIPRCPSTSGCEQLSEPGPELAKFGALASSWMLWAHCQRLAPSLCPGTAPALPPVVFREGSTQRINQARPSLVSSAWQRGDGASVPLVSPPAWPGLLNQPAPSPSSPSRSPEQPEHIVCSQRVMKGCCQRRPSGDSKSLTHSSLTMPPLMALGSVGM